MSHWSCEGGVCRMVEDDEELVGEGEGSADDAAASEPLKIGVLISGSGTNLQALIDRIADGSLNAQITLVVSSRPGVRGIERAEAAGLQTLVMEKSEYADDAEAADEKIAAALKEAGCEYVIMAGYMRMVRRPLLEAFENRIVNLHPALLPSFKGAHAIQDAYDYGVKVTGVTVHFADDKYDCGPIIAQRALTVEEGWTVEELEEHIHAVEHELYPEVVSLLAARRVHITPTNTVTIA
ncbi:phosphoribosylglycinamide formyltransferase [Paratractidigestivibacter sp.]|uniref:phosphoribosylglycinamide formyltransferase n=1 Tax=Paratractidigestivibacter sp. TaxID=2847316 RepID=UPI002AC90CCA|nr:phosphoribosylglycinamide formyltransferase [Paratractidigestivibacter sp.]